VGKADKWGESNNGKTRVGIRGWGSADLKGGVMTSHRAIPANKYHIWPKRERQKPVVTRVHRGGKG